MRAGILGMWQTEETQGAVGLSSNLNYTQSGAPQHRKLHQNTHVQMYTGSPLTTQVNEHLLMCVLDSTVRVGNPTACHCPYK